MWLKVRAKVIDIPEALLDLNIKASEIKDPHYVWTDKCIWSEDIKDFEMYSPSKVLVRFVDESRVVIQGTLDSFLALIDGDDNPPSQGKEDIENE